MLQMKEVPELVEDVIPKFVGQLYDSVVDIKAMSVGVALCITNNATIQGLIKSYVEWVLN